MKSDTGIFIAIVILFLILVPSISWVIEESDRVEVNQIGYRGR